jgi:hypothetical protein
MARYVIPVELAVEAVTRGQQHLKQETDPFIRRQLEDLIFYTSNPTSRRSVSALNTLMWLGRPTSSGATKRRQSLGY